MAGQEGYEVHLSQFEGPLDLLLHLVRKAEIDLKDIFVSQITEQYMEYMAQVNEVDLERQCEFLKTASLLLFIKSRSLLPVSPRQSGEEEEEDPEATLIENLRLYEMYKEASEQLRQRENSAERFLGKLPEDVEEGEVRLVTGDARALLEAYLRVLERRKNRIEAPPVMQIAAEAWSVDRQKAKIRRILSNVKGKTIFTSFFPEDAGPPEIVTTFAAMLELWNAEEISVLQTVPFGEIIVALVDNMGISREAG